MKAGTLFTPKQETEIVSILQSNPKQSRKELGEMFGLPAATIQWIAKKHGFVDQRHGGVKPTVLLKSLDEEIEELKKKLDEAKLKRERLSIRFEYAHGSVSVYGIHDNEEPVTAPVASWLRFLNNEGPSKLRDFTHTVNGQNGGIRK